MTLADLHARLRHVAEELEAFGASEAARAVETAADRMWQELEGWWNTPLSVGEAAEWGGYSASQLRRLLREGKLVPAPGGGIRRRHVPIQPGHQVPLGLEPVAEGDAADFVARVRTRREQRRAS